MAGSRGKDQPPWNSMRFEVSEEMYGDPVFCTNVAETFYKDGHYGPAFQVLERMVGNCLYERAYLVAAAACLAGKFWGPFFFTCERYTALFGITIDMYNVIKTVNIEDVRKHYMIYACPGEPDARNVFEHSIIHHILNAKNRDPKKLKLGKSNDPTQFGREKIAEKEVSTMEKKQDVPSAAVPRKSKRSKSKGNEPTKEAGQTSEKKESATEALQSFYKACEAAVKLLLNGQCSINQFRHAHDLMIGLPPGSVSEVDAVILSYLLCLQKIETGEYHNIAESIQSLEEMRKSHARILPAIFAALSKAYLTLNRHSIGEGWAGEGMSFLERGIQFSKRCYPQTNVTIPETCRVGLFSELTELIKQCKGRQQSDASCRHNNCLIENAHLIAPSKDIFYSDPNFDGFVTIHCTYRCRIEFHPLCWRALKQMKFSTQKMIDKDFLGEFCLTPDCQGKIDGIVIIGEDGNIKSRVPSNYSENSSIETDKQRSRKLRHASEGDMKKLECVENNNKNIKNDISKNQQRKNSLEPKYVHNTVDAQVESAETLLPNMKMVTPPSNETSENAGLSETPIMPLSRSPTIVHPKITIDRKTQTNSKTFKDAGTVPLPCSLQMTIDKLSAQKQSLNATIAKHISENHAVITKLEKLREKYMAKKHHSEELENQLKEIRGRDNREIFDLWSTANLNMIQSARIKQAAKVSLLKMALDYASLPKRLYIDNALEQLSVYKTNLEAVSSKFMEERAIKCQDDTRFELLSLPPDPEDPIGLHIVFKEIIEEQRNFPLNYPTHDPNLVPPQVLQYARPALIGAPHIGFLTGQPLMIRRASDQYDSPSTTQYNYNQYNPAAFDPSILSMSSSNNTLATSDTSNVTVKKPIASTHNIEKRHASPKSENEMTSSGSEKSINIPDTPTTKQITDLNEPRITKASNIVEPDVAYNLASGSFPPLQMSVKVEKKQTSTFNQITASTIYPKARQRTFSEVSNASSHSSNRNTAISPPVSVLSRLIHYIASNFPLKTDEEIHEYLNAIKNKNKSLARMSLKDLLRAVKEQIDNSYPKRSVLERFSGPAWNSLNSEEPERGIIIDNCSICLGALNDIDVFVLSCEHSFHLQCLRPWREKKSECPLCRKYFVLPDEFPKIRPSL